MSRLYVAACRRVQPPFGIPPLNARVRPLLSRLNFGSRQSLLNSSPITLRFKVWSMLLCGSKRKAPYLRRKSAIEGLIAVSSESARLRASGSTSFDNSVVDSPSVSRRSTSRTPKVNPSREQCEVGRLLKMMSS